jgi:hypothetical protein
MEFNADEAAKFCPSTSNTSRRRRQWGTRRWSLIKDYAVNYQSMTDQKAGVLLGRLMAVENKSTATGSASKSYRRSCPPRRWRSTTRWRAASRC